MGEPKCEKHEAVQEAQEKKMDELLENDRQLVRAIGEVKEQVIKNQQSSASAHHRLDSIEKHTEAIIKMSVSVDNLANEVKNSNEINQKKHEEHEKRLDILERKPGENVLNYWKMFIGAIVTGGAGYILATIKGVIN